MTIHIEEIHPLDWIELKTDFYKAAVRDAELALIAIKQQPSAYPDGVAERRNDLSKRRQQLEEWMVVRTNTDFMNLVIMVYGEEAAHIELINLIPKEIEYMREFIKSVGGTTNGTDETGTVSGETAVAGDADGSGKEGN